MQITKAFIILFLLINCFACGSGNQKPSSLFQIKLENNNTIFHQNDDITINIENLKKKEISEIEYSIDGKKLARNGNKIMLDVATLGNKVLTAKFTYDGTPAEITKKIQVLANKAPEIYTYTIINEFPHDNKAYTQGLEFHNDTLYEGTGSRGGSFLRKFDFKTGEVYERINLDATYFGEGITILNNKIYQLTWKSGMGFIYDLNSFSKIDNFNYGKSREGWGLTNDGEKLFKSDGTEKIWLLNPKNMIETGYIETVTNSSVFNKANELEYVDGKIYANVYQKPSAMIIDSKTGAIEGVINFSGLSDKITETENWDKVNNVLNGIAYHPKRKTFFVTGKYWDKMFEVTIQKK